MKPELYLDFDIETVPDDNVDEYLNVLHIKPDARLKDKDKIAENILEKRAKIKDLAGLSWWIAKPVAIVVYDEYEDKFYTFNDPNPVDLLTNFCNLLVTEFPNHILVGKNSSTFDIPMVTGWLLKHNLGVPDHFKRHLRGQPISDVDQIFGYSSRTDQTTTLDNYAFGMGIKMKTMHGNQVAELYRQHQMGVSNTAFTDLMEYCKNDVRIVTEMRKRFLKSYPIPVTGSNDELAKMCF